jgi:hypothetical protein
MSERALRGTRLGATSYESDNGIEFAPRQDVRYDCPNGHDFEVPFSMEAEVPAVWECRVCGAQALRVDVAAPQEKPGKPSRTHWDMLLERRSMADLEEVLAERLEVLRGGGIAYAPMMEAPMRSRAAADAEAQSGQARKPSVRPVAGTAARTPKKSGVVKAADRPAGKSPAKSGPVKAAAGKANSPTQ